MVFPPGAAQCVELLLPFVKEVLGPLQVAVQDVHTLLEGLEADPLPYAAQFGGGFAMLVFGQLAAVGQTQRGMKTVRSSTRTGRTPWTVWAPSVSPALALAI
ncbi:hypothetical protein GCM10011428_55820 [Streptomyces violaceus]